MYSFGILQDRGVQFFETVIRYLGGLLSVYAMTKDPLFLARADDLAHNLIGAFDTPQGLPTFMVNPKTYVTSFCWPCLTENHIGCRTAERDTAAGLVTWQFYPRWPAVRWNTDTWHISPDDQNTFGW